MRNKPEKAALVLFVIFQVALKVWNIFHYRFDSDEPQHLHVVWGWTRGLVQYRDLFDNHMPLFQILCAPVLGIMGEHARDLYWMRGLMLPLFLLSLWATYRIGEEVFSRRVGIWSAVLVACYGKYQLCSTEFRTDNLWALLWLLCLLILVGGKFSVRRALVSGVLLGLCFGVSMKSTLMLLTLGVALIMAASLVGWSRLGVSRREAAMSVAAFLGAAAIIPGIILAYFAANGVWPQMRYCVFEHNLITHAVSRRTYLHALILPVALPLLILGARKIFRERLQSPRAFRAIFLVLAGCVYLLILDSLWGHITRQDYLPFYPLAFVILAAALCALPTFSLTSRWSAPAIALIFLLLFNLAPTISRANSAARAVSLVSEILQLTQPGDYVFDRKGETVFRRRAFYYVLEGITRERMKNGKIPDNIIERCVVTRTCVAIIGKHLPLPAEQFFRANYLPGRGHARVAGYLLKPTPGRDEIEFTVAIPAEYELMAEQGTAQGLLDGTPCDQPRFLDAGKHSFRLTNHGVRVALVWAQAAQNNFSPFVRHRAAAPPRA